MEIDYPHGSTGHFFSNHAVRILANSTDIFDACPAEFCEDVCVRFTMDRLQIPFYEGCTSKFVITFPHNISSLVTAEACPRWAVMTPGSKIRVGHGPVVESVTLHMHGIPTESWTDWILRAQAAKMSVIWINGPVFCIPTWARSKRLVFRLFQT
jgi:hypothetical protein